MPTMTRAIFLVSISLLASCGNVQDSGDEGCAKDTIVCVDDTTFLACVDGEFGEEETCPADESCMEIEDGVEVCVDPLEI